MPHETPLIATIVVGLVVAFIFGAIANRLRVPPLVGYLLAGVLAGSHTPGFVADQELAAELAEIGVILLMFGVGLHFSLKDLLSVRAIAIPGAIVQIVVATLLGAGLAWILGWSMQAGFVFGLALSVASTVVLLRAMQERRLIEEVWTRYGERRAFKGWYLSKEIAENNPPVVAEFCRYSRLCKTIAPDLPIMISPGMRGRKAWLPDDPKAHDLDFAAHEAAWEEVMSRISGLVDIIAFQDGHVTFDELPRALAINKRIADKYGIETWTNCESFDRDMPFRFPPIKWEKLLLKLKAAEAAGIEKALTFEFSHFMSPNSFWRSAGHLYNRYREYLAEIGGC